MPPAEPPRFDHRKPPTRTPIKRSAATGNSTGNRGRCVKVTTAERGCAPVTRASMVNAPERLLVQRVPDRTRALLLRDSPGSRSTTGVFISSVKPGSEIAPSSSTRIAVLPRFLSATVNAPPLQPDVFVGETAKSSPSNGETDQIATADSTVFAAPLRLAVKVAR